MNRDHNWHLSRHRNTPGRLVELTSCGRNVMAPKVLVYKNGARGSARDEVYELHGAAASADRVSTGWKFPTASNLLLFFLSLFLQLLLSFPQLLQLFLDS